MARIVHEHLCAAGCAREKRRGWFSALANTEESSEHKSTLRLWAEQIFLFAYPKFAWAVIPGVSLAVRADLWFLRTVRRPPALVVSHTALRLLAFHVGHLPHTTQWKLPASLETTLRSVPKHGIVTLVVDTDTHIRLQRIAERIHRDKVDFFDLYMAAHPALGEQIAQALREIAMRYLEATPLPNNTPGEGDVRRTLTSIWPTNNPPAEHSA